MFLRRHLCLSLFYHAIGLAKRKKEKSRPPPSAPRDLIIQNLVRIHASVRTVVITRIHGNHCTDKITVRQLQAVQKKNIVAEHQVAQN